MGFTTDRGGVIHVERPLIGGSRGFAITKSTAARVAKRHSTVLIFGETGSGKELLARYVHSRSTRADQAFIPVDCSSLSENLFESELFGHVRGAFTGATRDALGFIRAANGGTLFLDEIGELSLPTQAKLLRVIQERRVVPVGESRSIPVDIRIVAATHRDLAKMVLEGRFRQDLYFRLNVVTLQMPPLRERIEDILPLAEHFLRAQADIYDETMKTLSPEATSVLLKHDWPGNVREMANVMEQAHVLSHGETIGLLDLPPHLAIIAERGTVADRRGSASCGWTMSSGESSPRPFAAPNTARPPPAGCWA